MATKGEVHTEFRCIHVKTFDKSDIFELRSSVQSVQQHSDHTDRHTRGVATSTLYENFYLAFDHSQLKMSLI